MIRRAGFLIGWLAAAASAAVPPRTAPGPLPDGSTLLHNQWPIRPVGRQVKLGDFPVNVAVDPSGRYAAVLHAGHGPHEVRVVDLQTGQTTARAPVRDTFYGIAFSRDGRTLICSGGSDWLLHVFAFDSGRLRPRPDQGPKADLGMTSGVVLSPDGREAAAARLYENQIALLDRPSGAVRWTARLGPALSDDPNPPHRPSDPASPPNDALAHRAWAVSGDPLALLWDRRGRRIFASLWGESAVAVIDAQSGRVTARWPCGLHPNELALSSAGLLYVANGGLNTVTVLDTRSGQAVETLSSAMAAGELPGSTPDGLALSPDGKTLFVANADNNNLAVFDVSQPAHARPLGFIPTGWMPSSVRLTPDGKELLVISARGLRPRSNDPGHTGNWPHIDELYPGSLGIVELPAGEAFDRSLATWTKIAAQCRPAPVVPPPAGSPIPDRAGAATPLRYVIYIIKENRTYDQVFGDMPQGNGDPRICLFPEKVTPNHHALARRFVLLDNLYANAEVSASGHEWSMGAYASEYVEKIWPISYGHHRSNVYYPAEGQFAAAVPALGYLWDRAAAAGISFRSHGEFVANGPTPADPVTTNLPSLRGRFDPYYHGFDLKFPDQKRADRFLVEFRAFEAAGEMPRLQIVRLPNDHTDGARLGQGTPAAMVADNDLALGRVVEAVSHSRFWPQTAIFVIEDDAQNGPDHVDAHRTVGLVACPYVRSGTVDSTAYTTCSMLRTMELILGLAPMSQFDAAAQPMWASFQLRPDPAPYAARPAQVDLNAKNVQPTRAARISEGFDLSREDAIDDQVFNRVIWATVRGEHDPMPAPVHAAFVRGLPKAGDDDDD